MKRFFESLAIVAALAFSAIACQSEALAPAEPSIPVPDVPGVSISILSSSDNAFSFKVAPTSAVAWYSYLVTDQKLAAVDSFNVYALRYSGIEAKRLDYASNKSYTAEISDVEDNATYYIYAVAADSSNFVSSVATATVSTSDTVGPQIVNFQYQDNMVLLVFSEEVSYVEGKDIWAEVHPFMISAGAPVIEKTVADVQVSGNQALLTFPEITTPGSLFVVNVPEGAFIDDVGQKTPAYSSAITDQDEDGNPVFADGSIFGYMDAGEIEYEDATPATLVDWKTPVKLVTCKTPIYMLGKDAVVAKIVHEAADRTVTTEYTPLALNDGYFVLEDGYTIAALLPEEPARGDLITFEIKEESILDIYGNVNAAISLPEPDGEDEEASPILYSYGFTVADVLGTYQNDGVSGYGPVYNEEPWTLTVAESDDAEKGNVMLSSYYDLPCKIYAEWDGDAGTLTIIDEGNLTYVCGFTDEAEEYYFEFYLTGYYHYLGGADATGAPIVLYMKEKGSFYSGTDYLGYWYYQFNIPESGNLEDLTESDLVNYDYNIFLPILSGVEAAGAPAKVSTYFPFPKADSAKPQVSLTRVLAK